jgi:glycosyltransferase involved in cell wall biosynthesis
MRYELEAYTAKNGLQDKVRIFDTTPDPSAIFSESNILVLPSKSEGLSYVLIEGAGRGIALIASDVDGNHEIAINGHTGILINTRDERTLESAMLRLATDVDYRVKLGQNGRALVEEKFNITKFVNQLIWIYQKMFDR